MGYSLESPEELLANPKRWRIHPKGQQDAAAGLLSEVGWVGTILVNQRTGHVVNGHMLTELALTGVFYSGSPPNPYTVGFAAYGTTTAIQAP